VRDYLVVHESEGSSAAVNSALQLFDIDEFGLDRLDRAVLKALLTNFAGGPAGISTLASAVGEDSGTIESVVEPYLVREGLISRTQRGRVATQRGWDVLGLKPPSGL
jgi:Holliday junction DNA helicase RuvB